MLMTILTILGIWGIFKPSNPYYFFEGLKKVVDLKMEREVVAHYRDDEDDDARAFRAKLLACPVKVKKPHQRYW